ncbi:uncharacterized protein LOC130794780 [Actinidia eriantha]|uniref:uncharacterized protein LOC130794780 n=1 Tax=Actinidia eriantha TaxID=165200 RepID=UPI0025857720|nr:uncharacterized protein LOC130794780 [Actinidia eriantha]XP_057512722.1 uncharacterized protein LOC130794780 [Actinidia eriantha]XP_057512723.1 uncharacterized protein LOC130794780 [Actinidia eriantha]
MTCIRICLTDIPNCFSGYNNPFQELRKIWDEWDLRILVLFILFTQLYLHFFGRHRRKSMARVLVNVNVWLLYLFSDLLATIALGKLSKVKDDSDLTKLKDDSKVDIPGTNKTLSQILEDLRDTKKTMPQILRGLWAPVILFCLGGPDTMTVLRLEENHLWVRHLIGLFTQGLRTVYVLILTWNPNGLSILALLLLIPGIIKYGERVWVIRSRSGGKYQGFIKLDETTIDETINSASQPNANLVLQAYSCFQILNPHIDDYECNSKRLKSLVERFSKSVDENLAKGDTDIENSFRLIEIELGLIYDMLFSKVGTIFTIWGSILRSISFSCLVSVFVSFFLIAMPPGRVEGDFLISIILLVGAIFLEIAGILVQLISDWVIVWARKYPGRLANLVLRVHEFLIPERKRWSGFMGQFSFLNFCEEYKPTRYRKMVQSLCGREKMLSRFGSLIAVQLSVKKLIIKHLFEKFKERSDALQPIAMKRGEWSIEKYKCPEFKWSVELEFNRSLVIWHLATHVCYHSEYVLTDEMKAANILSNYMMYLLLVCPSRFPFCDKYDKLMEDYDILKELVSSWSNERACENQLEQDIDFEDTTVANQVQHLVKGLREKADRWEIMRNVWVEMLCYASSQFPPKHHVEELRHGGEFLTHVWLLVMHFGVGRKADRNLPKSRKDEYDAGTKTTGTCFEDLRSNAFDKYLPET